MRQAPIIQKPYPGSGEIVRQACRLKGIPEAAIKTYMQSLSEVSLRQYNSSLLLWWQYCYEKGVPIFSADVPQVIAFFQYLLDTKNWIYGTFNTCRSALSLILPGELGTDLRIRRFLKGISRCRPARPKYNCSWDPKVVLDHLKEQYPNETLTLDVLNKKLIMLLMLITGHRLQTLALIKVTMVVIDPDGIQIFIDENIKTSGPHSTQPVLNIPFFKDNPTLCVASLLIHYIERTSELRSSSEEGDYLFISAREPYHRVSKQTLARWIKFTMASAGINTSRFAPHSARHASTSRAFRRGISVDLIRKTAGWSDSSLTFTRFYNRPLDNRFEFAKAVFC